MERQGKENDRESARKALTLEELLEKLSENLQA